MSLLTEVVEGWTKRLTFTLQTDGAAFNGTGMTISNLYITNARGVPIDTAGDFGWVSAAAGTVYYDPDAADFVAGDGPYTVRYEVTDGAGKVVFFPNGQADQIQVRGKRG
jgi:hypothetical protein